MKGRTEMRRGANRRADLILSPKSFLFKLHMPLESGADVFLVLDRSLGFGASAVAS
jgi:hypothetical protein